MKRCAIYTRKSTDEGLDQSFNSLDAQREASEAYVVSQRHEGWLLVKKAYDDGGFSGGSMERPALQRLLADIQSGIVDIVVVYKIDRLTRSLADFAKMVEVFDARGVSFVSVTQQFNTTTSMGRLTLNVLLSFAQFEREVTAERIRDKIAASKKKGMWMGGSPPLGYDIRDKKLVPNPEEARKVRQLFEAYLDLGSTRVLTRWAREQGITTKVRYHTDGKIRSGGKPFSRGNLHALLRYRTYMGEVAYKGSIYPGDHAAILPRDLWDQVHARLASRPNRRRAGQGTPPSLPLTGLVFDETGDRLTPVHATKKGRRYYYYVSSRLNQTDTPDPSGWRLPASVLERAVAAGVLSFLTDNRRLQHLLEHGVASQMMQAYRLNEILSRSKQLADRIQQSDSREAAQVIVPALHRIDFGAGCMTMRINVAALFGMLGHVHQSNMHRDAAAAAQCIDDARSMRQEAAAGTLQDAQNTEFEAATAGDASCAITVPLTVKRRGVETRLILGNGREPLATPDQILVRTVAKARTWFEDLKSGAVASINDIAARDNIPASEVSRQLPLAFLSPRIVTAILAGRQPVELTAKTLQRIADLPLDWNVQAQLLGFHTT